MSIRYVHFAELNETLSVDRVTVRRWRQQGLIQENLHYFTQGPKNLLYNLFLMESFVRYRQHPEEHLKDIQVFKDWLQGIRPN